MSTQQHWLTKMNDLQRTGKTSEVLSPPLKLCWKERIGEMNLWSSPVVSDDVVYMPSEFGLHALKLEDASLLWRLEEVTIHVGAPTIWKDRLFACGMECVYAIDRSSGEIQWRYGTDKLISDCAPGISEKNVFWGSADGFLYALDIESGGLRWKYEATEWVYFSPSVLEDTVYSGTVDSTFFALDAAIGTLKWRRKFEGTFGYNSSAPIYDDKIFVSVKKHGLSALDLATGEVLWTYKTPYGPFTAPCVADGIVYVASRRLHAVEAESGQEIWTSPHQGGLFISAPIISGDYIYIGGGHGRFVHAFNRHTGEKVWEHKTGDIVFSTPAIASGKLLIGCHDGYLYCFEEA